MRRILFAVFLCLSLTPLWSASAHAGFDADAFRKNFAAGLALQPGHPRLTAANVTIEAVEKAADFAGTQIYMVKGRLAAGPGKPRPFLLSVSADGRFYLPDLVDLRAGESVLAAARDHIRADEIKGFGGIVLRGAGSARVLVVSDPFCPFCREAVAYLFGHMASIAELRLAHYPLSSHVGSETACALMEWARVNDAKRLADFVRFAYAGLAAPRVADMSAASRKRAREAVAGAFLKQFPEVAALGKSAGAVVAALSVSKYAAAVRQDAARALSLGVRGTPVVFVNAARVEGFDKARLDELLK